MQRNKDMIRRGVVMKIDGDGKMQRVNADTLTDVSLTGIEHFQPAGFASSPETGDGSECLVLNIGGDPSKAVCIMATGDRKYHLKVGGGEAAIYSPTNPEHKVTVKPDGIYLDSAGTKVTVKPDGVYLDSDNVMVKRGGGFKRVAAQGDVDTRGHALV